MSSVSRSEGARILAEALKREIPHLRRRATPGFPEVARRIVEVWGAQPGLEGEVSRLLHDMGRFAAGTWALYLEATPGGLTIARLSETLKGTTVSGPGRARAILTYLSFIKYIEREPGQEGGREKRYRTTETMRAAFRERMRRELAVRADLDPAVATVLERFDELFIDYLVVVSEVIITQMTLAQHPVKNELDLFSERYAGMIILCEMMLNADPDDDFLPRGGLNFTVAELARRCGTSRMQVNNLLKKARAAGLLLPNGDGRERLSEALIENTVGLIAGSTDMLVGAARIVVNGSPTFFDDESASGASGTHPESLTLEPSEPT